MNPEDVDLSEYYDDDALILWHSVTIYLQLLSKLPITQDYIHSDKLKVISGHYIAEQFPNIHEGICMECDEILGSV